MPSELVAQSNPFVHRFTRKCIHFVTDKLAHGLRSGSIPTIYRKEIASEKKSQFNQPGYAIMLPQVAHEEGSRILFGYPLRVFIR
jgi:hypothetical protein